MNINIEDIKFLEKWNNEKPTKGKVWQLAKQGKNYDEIAVEIGYVCEKAQDCENPKS